ncbi:MAG: hydantoinase/oxoprolinase family protein [Acidimicrobiales bacterium]
MTGPSGYSVGIDIGGTFTDVVVADHANARLYTAKHLTTPSDPAQGVLGALDLALTAAGLAAESLTRSVHATTLATNLILERQGANVAYITTDGFGDLLVIGHDRRGDADKFNLLYDKQPPLVPRRRTVEVIERLSATGEVVVPLDEAQAEAAIVALLAREQVDAVAVCFLHSHANPEHERRVGAIVRRLRPELFVTLSSEVWPEYRELPRANTTVVSAYVGPTVTRYIEQLEHRLAERGVRVALQIMQSSGGTTSAASAAKRPIQLIESGPAAGVIAAAYAGGRCGIDDLISFDMGGTTAKAGVVTGGKPSITNDFAVGGYASAGLKRVATGYAVKLPVVDLAEVGAGGGSIARVDPGGIVRVGPDSAGSEPGPACYSRGGLLPTVTDANLVLGYLNADYFLGGAMQVSLEAARAAVDEHLAQPLGLTIEEAAAGVHEIVNANMAAAIRVVTIERGIDPRGFTLVASGGAGPAHVVRLAEAFDIPQVLVPANPGVGSAIGLVVSDVVFDSVRTRVFLHADIDPAVIDALYCELTDAARSQVRAEGFDDANIRIEREIDVRFRHQAHELGVPLDDGEITPATLVQAEASFRDTYERLYGVRPSDPVEFVNYRVRAVGRVDKPDWAVDAQAHGAATPVSQRAVHFGEHDGFIDTPVYRRSSLAPGHVIEGPAIVEEPTSSIVVPPKWTASVDQRLNLIIRR